MDQTLDLSFFDTASNNDFFDSGVGKTLEGSNEIDTSNPTTVDTTTVDTSAEDTSSVEDAFSNDTDYMNIPSIPEDNSKKPKFTAETKKLNFEDIAPTNEAVGADFKKNVLNDIAAGKDKFGYTYGDYSIDFRHRNPYGYDFTVKGPDGNLYRGLFGGKVYDRVHIIDDLPDGTNMFDDFNQFANYFREDIDKRSSTSDLKDLKDSKGSKELAEDYLKSNKELAEDYLRNDDIEYIEANDDAFGIYDMVGIGNKVIQDISSGKYDAEEAGDILTEALSELEIEANKVDDDDPVAGSIISGLIFSLREKGFEAIDNMSKGKATSPVERKPSSTSAPANPAKSSDTKLPPGVKSLDDVFGEPEAKATDAVQDIFDKYNANLQDAVKNGFAPDLARQAYQALKDIGAPAEDVELMYEQIQLNASKYGSSGSKSISFANDTTTKENLEEMKKKGLPTKQEFFESANKKLAEFNSNDGNKKIENASGFIGRALAKGLVAAIKEGDAGKIGEALSDWKDVTKEKRQAVVDDLAKGNIMGALKASRGTNVFNMILGLVASGEITGNSDLIPEDFMKPTSGKDTSSNEDLNVMQTEASAPKKSDYTGYNEGLQRGAYSDETKKKFKANVMRLYGKPLRERVKSYD